jgi:hypothetical protein
VSSCCYSSTTTDMSVRPVLLLGAGLGGSGRTKNHDVILLYVYGSSRNRAALGRCKSVLWTCEGVADAVAWNANELLLLMCCDVLCFAGVLYLAGVPVIDWIFSLVQIVYYGLSALLWAFWQLLQPAQDQRHSSLPELHQVGPVVSRRARGGGGPASSCSRCQPAQGRGHNSPPEQHQLGGFTRRCTSASLPAKKGAVGVEGVGCNVCATYTGSG